ncbi:hypothetical protein BKA56DRAFT_505963 [Ilyonectria sp. MPI-CAGE-AT-0026]|nr:hypothetical protein BKA56DRAFT_505963 [Ilyonectria sp. MPI-CAGE-AT-0026]
MKYPPRKHHSRTHDSRARPYPSTQHQTDRKSRTSKVRSRRSEDVDPPRSTHPRPKKVARRDPQTTSNDRGGGYGPRSPAEQTVEDESTDYQSESRGDYGGDSASDSGEENASQSHSELEQLKDQIIEFRREQSQQIHRMDKRTRELAQQYVSIFGSFLPFPPIIREQPKGFVEKILPANFQGGGSIMQGKQDQAHHGATGELGTIDPVEMFSKGSEPFG